MPPNNSPHLIKPGDKFSRLTVIAFSHHDKRWRRHYRVKCDCGVEKTVQGTLLRDGNTRSCGCLAMETRRAKRLPNSRGVINHLILQYKRHARQRGLAWELTYDDVAAMVKKPCHYCGAVESSLKKTKNCKEGFGYNGIDRLDSSLGYNPVNCVPCCGTCNVAKNDMTVAEFHSWILRVSAMAVQWSEYLANPAAGEEYGLGDGSATNGCVL